MTNVGFFTSLPLELKEKIINFVNYKTLNEFRLVSKQFKDIADNEKNWEQIGLYYRNYFPFKSIYINKSIVVESYKKLNNFLFRIFPKTERINNVFHQNELFCRNKDYDLILKQKINYALDSKNINNLNALLCLGTFPSIHKILLTQDQEILKIFINTSLKKLEHELNNFERQISLDRLNESYLPQIERVKNLINKKTFP